MINTPHVDAPDVTDTPTPPTGPQVEVEIMLAPGAIMPTYATRNAAALDLHYHPDTPSDSDAEIVIQPGNVVSVPTGVFLGIPVGYEGQVRPRSGLALHRRVTVLNTPGTIDADYRGEIRILLHNHGDQPFKIFRGVRIAQLVITPVPCVRLRLVDQLDDTPRGASGFGSTGK